MGACTVSGWAHGHERLAPRAVARGVLASAGGLRTRYAGAMALWAGLAVALLCATYPVTARAQLLLRPVTPPLYDGVVVTYELNYDLMSSFVDFLIFNLGPVVDVPPFGRTANMDIVSIVMADTPTPVTVYSEANNACASFLAGTSTTCALGNLFSNTFGIPIVAALSEDANGRHFTVSRAMTDRWPSFFVTVRLHPVPGCQSASANWGTLWPPDLTVDAVACTAPPLLDLSALTGPWAASRGGATAQIALTGTVSGTPTDFVDPGAIGPAPLGPNFDRLFWCRNTTAAAAFVPCTDPAFASFAALEVTQTSPVTVRLTAVDSATPQAGNAQVQVRIGTTTWPVFDVAVEQEATRCTLALGGPARITVGTSTTLTPGECFNTDGGHERPAISAYQIIGTTPPVDAPTLATLVQLDPSTGQLTLNKAPPQDLAVSIGATHTRRDGASFATGSITVDASPGPPGCVLVAARTSLGVGGSTELHVEQMGGVALPDGAPVSWSALDGLVPDAADSRRATYTAGTQAGVVHVEVGLPASACYDPMAALDLDVRADVQVRITLDKKNVPAGGLAHIVVHLLRVDPATATDPIRIELGAQDGVRLLGNGPVISQTASGTVASGTAASPAWVAPDAMGLRVVATSAQRASLVVTLPADGNEDTALDFPVLARAAFACGTARVEVAAYRGDAGGSVLASDQASLVIGCDPELSLATLVGRVFYDRNGDGEQDEGEEGLPGAIVATSSGMWATSDATGSYHMARLAPGHVVVKVDLASLPAGAQVVDERRALLLTPGVFTRASFAVQLPTLELAPSAELVRAESGVRFVAGALAYEARLRLPIEGTLEAWQGEARIAGVRQGGLEQSVTLPLGATPHWLLTLFAADGRVWLWSLSVNVYAQAGGDQLVVPWGPRPLAALSLPVVAATGHVPVRALLAEDAVLRVRANGAGGTSGTRGVGGTGGAAETGGVGGTCEWHERGSPPACELDLHGAGELVLSIAPPSDAAGDAPPLMQARHALGAVGVNHFLVGLAGVELGYGKQREDAASSVAWDTQGSFYYRGTFGERARLTAGADAQARDLVWNKDGSRSSSTALVARLFGHDPRRVFRNLDPEAYYPTYGDDSTTVDERESGGRLYLRLEVDKSFLKWGGLNTGVAGTEVGQYVRSLYGAGARLSLGGPTQPYEVTGTAFGAKPDSQAVRDDLVVTGGTMYFLSRGDVVEGSVRATLELLDEVSGLPTRSLPLREGADFEMDYLGGRLSLDAALPYRTFGGSLTEAGPGGQRGRLLVDYEYYPGSDWRRDWTAGATLAARYGALSVGGSAVSELAGSVAEASWSARRYTLVGAHAGLDLAPGVRARLELARSEGQSHAAAASSDGGLTYAAVGPSVMTSGDAAVAEVSARADGVSASLYGRYRDSGFADSRTAPGSTLKQAGLKVGGDLATRTRLWGQADRRELQFEGAGPISRDVALFGAAQGLGPVTLGVEGRYEGLPRVHAQRVVAAGELAWRFAPHWQAALKRRQELERRDAPADAVTGLPKGALRESAVGLAYLDPSVFSIGAEAGATDSGTPFGRLYTSVPLADGTDLYASYLMTSPIAYDLAPEALRGNALVLGGRRALDDGTRLYAQEHVGLDEGQRRLVRSVGFEVPLARRVGFTGSYERGAVEAADGSAPLTRDAGSVGLVMQTERVMVQLATDGRYDAATSGRSLQVGAHSRAELRVTPELTLAAGVRGASNYTVAGARAAPRTDSWEGSAGFAVRPVSGERVSVFGRYALGRERGAGGSGSGSGSGSAEPAASSSVSLSHTVALAAVVHPVRLFDVGPKVYYRHTAVRVGDLDAVDQALLGTLRGDLHMTDVLDATLEARSCAALGGGTLVRYGALTELGAWALPWLRLGAGYNFSTIATGTVQCSEPGAHGPYVRAEAVY